MSIQDFHAQLVSGNNNKNLLFGALSKLRQVADPKVLFDDTTAGDWPIWNGADGAAACSPAGQPA